MRSLRAAPVLVLLVAGLIAPSAARAHAELVTSEPAANSSLPEAPRELTLTFTEPIDAASSVIRLLDTRQAEIPGLGALATSGDGTEASVSLPELDPGTYTVSYQVTSSVDGHVTSGIFAFLIDPTGTEPAPALPTESESLSSEPGGIAARWLALAGALALAGILIFWIASATPALRRSDLDPVRAPWGPLALVALLALAGTFAYLVVAAAPILEAGTPRQTFPLDPAGPFGWTQFAMAMRVAVAGALAALILAVSRWLGGRAESASDRPWLWIMLAAGLVSLAGMSLAGHAAATGGLAYAAIDFLHLLGVATWIGTLLGLVFLVRVARPALGGALRRHSRLALVAAPVVVLTGLANSPLVLGEQRELLASGYGNLLLAKAGLFSVAVAIGAVNFQLVRRGAGRRVIPLLATELVVGALAVLVAAGMVTGQPSASRAPVLATSAIGTAHLYGTAGESSVHAAINLPSPGQQRYQVSVSDLATGAYRTDVQRVFLVFTPPAESGLPPERVSLDPAEQDGLWGTTGAYTPVVGDWGVEIVVRRAGELDESATFPLEVSQPLPPQLLPPPDTGVGVPVVLSALWSLLPGGVVGWAWVVGLLVLLVLLLAAGRYRRNPALRWAQVALAALVVVAGLGVGSRAAVQAANAVPAELAARQNPVPAEPASVERGASLYGANCAVCHGDDGAGDGPAAGSGMVDLAPFSAVVPSMTDGQLEHRIAVGVAGTRMPAFAATLPESDRWDLVNYLRRSWPGS